MPRIIKISADGPLKCLLCGEVGWVKTSRTNEEVEQMERCPYCQVNYRRKEFRLADIVWVRWDWPKPGIVEAKVLRVDVDTLTLSLVGVKGPPPGGVRSWPPVIVFAKELVGWTPDEIYEREKIKADEDKELMNLIKALGPSEPPKKPKKAAAAPEEDKELRDLLNSIGADDTVASLDTEEKELTVKEIPSPVSTESELAEIKSGLEATKTPVLKEIEAEPETKTEVPEKKPEIGRLGNRKLRI